MLTLPKEEVEQLLRDIYSRWGKERAEEAAAHPAQAVLSLLLAIKEDVQHGWTMTRFTVERGSFGDVRQQAKEILERAAAKTTQKG